MNELANVVRKLAVEAVKNERNTDVITATVLDCPIVVGDKDDPKIELRQLVIQVSDKILLKEGDSFLKLSKVMQEKLHSTELPLYINRGDTAILIRMDKGSTYVFMDVM